MPQISLTTFVDYIAATGTSRLTRVRAAKKQYDAGYSPATDFYGPLRKRIVQTFEEGWDPKRLDLLLAEVEDPKKAGHYASCRRGIRKWAGVSGKKTITWCTPKKAVWTSGSLDVNVSPELWVDVDSDPHVIKLYFKSDKLSQHKVNLSLRLLENTVGKYGTVGIIDLQQGRLFTQTTEPQRDRLAPCERGGRVGGALELPRTVGRRERRWGHDRALGPREEADRREARSPGAPGEAGSVPSGR